MSLEACPDGAMASKTLKTIHHCRPVEFSSPDLQVSLQVSLLSSGRETVKMMMIALCIEPLSQALWCQY